MARNHSRIGVAAALVATLALGLRPTAAHHNATHDQNPDPPPALGPTTILHFEAGSLIIPMDACYARPSFMSATDINQIISPLNTTTAKCNGNSEKDNGLIPAYTLMFRLIQAGIPVNWSIRHNKTSWHSTDFSVVRAGGGPVHYRLPGSATNTTKYSGITTIAYRGAPFVIDSEHAADALTLIDSLAGVCETGTCYSAVDIHIAQVSFDVPVYRTVESLPKLAVINTDDPLTNFHNPQSNFLEGSIDEALMADLEGTLFDWLTIPQVLAGELDDSYDLAWVSAFDVTAAPTVRQQQFFDALATFADGGGSILLQDGSIAAAEGFGTWGASYTQTLGPIQSFQTNGGVIANGTSSTWDNGNDSEITRGQDYSDPASQFGGIVWTGVGGSQYNWKPRYDRAYHSGVRRMIYTDHTTDSSKDRWDLASWRKKDNDADKGTIYYLGGYNWRRVTASGFRVLMNTLLTTVAGEPDSITEVARSSPIIASAGGTEAQFAGTFEAVFPPVDAPTYASSADDSTFRFPHVKGHLRAIDLSDIAEGSTAFDDLGSGAVIFDAADHLPAISVSGSGCTTIDGSCRHIFTNTGADSAPTKTIIAEGNLATLKPLLDPDNSLTLSDAEATYLINRIHAGDQDDDGDWVAALGGVDRSTVAVIEQSPLIPVTRPTMAYFGGRDGMLHAVCVEAGSGCPSAGTELWAFMPAVELQKVVTNTTRIDGSPKVADVFGDFSTGKAMRTVLVFQTGNEEPSATYALDVTNPASPTILWEKETAGAGLGVAMGWVRDNSSITPYTFIQTNSGGAESGMTVMALDTATGEEIWSFTQTYPDRGAGNDAPPIDAMPGGVTLLPSLSGSTIDNLLVPSLWGAVYKLNARTGVNAYGTDDGQPVPLFQFTEDFHPVGAPVSLYRNDEGVLHALVVTGGYADPFSPSGVAWAPDDANQYAVGFPAAPDEGLTPIQPDDDELLDLLIDFGAGQRAFSPAVIAGTEVFITTDNTDVNSADYGETTNTGTLWRANLADTSATPTTTAIPSGAASVDVSLSTGAVVSVGGSGVHRYDPPDFASVGTTTEVSPETSATRRLWLRLR